MARRKQSDIERQYIEGLQQDRDMWRRRYERAYPVIDAAIKLLTAVPHPSSFPRLRAAVDRWIEETANEMAEAGANLTDEQIRAELNDPEVLALAEAVSDEQLARMRQAFRDAGGDACLRQSD